MTTNWNSPTKHSTSYTDGSKNVAAFEFDARHRDFGVLLTEAGIYCLLESGDNILLDEGGAWDFPIKN